MKYPEVDSKERFKSFLKKLDELGKPTKVDQSYLNSIGFKSSNHRSFVPAIKFIGLVENKRGGDTTPRWTFMKSNFESAIAEGVLEGYHELFQTYTNAHLQDDEVLFNFFKGQTSESNDRVANMVNAFRAFVELGNFESALDVATVNDQERITEPSIVGSKQDHEVNIRDSFALNVNIQLQVPLDTSGEAYEKFFEAMRKHLLT